MGHLRVRCFLPGQADLQMRRDDNGTIYNTNETLWGALKIGCRQSAMTRRYAFDYDGTTYLSSFKYKKKDNYYSVRYVCCNLHLRYDSDGTTLLFGSSLRWNTFGALTHSVAFAKTRGCNEMTVGPRAFSASERR